MPSSKKPTAKERFNAGDIIKAGDLLAENPLWELLDDFDQEICSLLEVNRLIDVLPADRPPPSYLRQQIFVHVANLHKCLHRLWKIIDDGG